MKWMNRPLLQLNIGRFWRRAIVISLYTSFLSLLIIWFLIPGLPGGHIAAQWVTLAGFIIILGSHLTLHFSTQGNAEWHVTTVSPRDLDERQEDLRNKAYFRGYVLLGIMLSLIILFSERLGLGWSFVAGLAAYIALPTSILAWLEPDPIQDESATYIERKTV